MGLRVGFWVPKKMWIFVEKKISIYWENPTINYFYRKTCASLPSFYSFLILFYIFTLFVSLLRYMEILSWVMSLKSILRFKTQRVFERLVSILRRITRFSLVFKLSIELKRMTQLKTHRNEIFRNTIFVA